MAAENQLLAMLPPSTYQALQPHLERVRLEAGQILAEDGEYHEHAFFPLDSVCSVIVYMEDGTSMEVGLIGSEGIATTATFLSDGLGRGDVVVQVPGVAWRITATVLRSIFDDAPELRAVLLRYTQSFLMQVTQSCACNGLHSIQQRCARWLLMMSDRVTTDEFDLSQALLARMLGVRRPTVSLATSDFRDSGLIRFNRGRLAILDRGGLERSACTCYARIASEQKRLLSTPT